MADRRIWAFASTTGALAWFLHFLIIYAIGEFFCVMEGTAFVFLGFNTTQWSVALFTLVLFILCLVATAVAWKQWRLLSRQPDQGNNRGGTFLMSTGVLSNLFFAFVILFEAVPIFFLGGEC